MRQALCVLFCVGWTKSVWVVCSFTMNFRHVIWDWNGTLLDDVWLCVDVINGMLQRRGLPQVDVARYREVFTFPVINVYRAMGFDVSRGEFERMSVEYIEAYQARRRECRLHEGVRDVLAAVRGAGFGQYILSAYRQDMLDSLVSDMGLGGYFDFLAGNGDIYAEGKVAHGRRLLERIGADPSEVLMVGDTGHDLEVARELGIRCVLVEFGHFSLERLRALGVPTMPSMRAVADYIGLVPERENDSVPASL